MAGTQNLETTRQGDDEVNREVEEKPSTSSSTNSSSTRNDEDVEKAQPTAQTQPTSMTNHEDPNVVFWDGPDDPENPMNWSFKLKLGSVALVSTWTLLTPLASSMVAPGTLTILRDFHNNSATLGSFIVSIYILGYAKNSM